MASKSKKKLYQSCHIFHKKGKFYITHFKEMFLFDGKPCNMDADDIIRRNNICHLLEQWNLITVIDKSKIGQLTLLKDIVIVPFKDKDKWELCPKYAIRWTQIILIPHKGIRYAC